MLPDCYAPNLIRLGLESDGSKWQMKRQSKVQGQGQQRTLITNGVKDAVTEETLNMLTGVMQITCLCSTLLSLLREPELPYNLALPRMEARLQSELSEMAILLSSIADQEKMLTAGLPRLRLTMLLDAHMSELWDGVELSVEGAFAASR